MLVQYGDHNVIMKDSFELKEFEVGNMTNQRYSSIPLSVVSLYSLRYL